MRGIHRSAANSPHEGQWSGALIFSLISAWINGWVNNHEAGELPKPKIYFPWLTQHDNIPNTHVSAYCRQSLRSTLIYISMETVRLCIQTAINIEWKCLGTPDCENMKNILIYFIWLNVQAKYLIQTLFYHFKWDMALWKCPKCPHFMQRTWWQTVATHHTVLT